MAEFENHSEFSQTDPLYALPDEGILQEKQESEEPISPGKRFWDVVKREKYKIGAGTILAGPFLAGLAQGLSPRDALVYGALQIATIGASESPDPELVRHMMHAIASHDTAGVVTDFRRVESDLLDSYKELLKDAGIFGVFGKIMYDKLHGATTHREAVIQGIAPIKPKGEEVIVLGGSHSYVADSLSSGRDRNGFVLVFENAEGGQEALLRNRRKVKNNEPVYLNLNITQRDGLSYLRTPAWERLKLTKDNLIHSENGKRYLLVVGCGEKADEELSLRVENVDVTQDDLRSAAIRLKGLLKKGDLVEKRDIIDVYIGNAALGRVNIEDLQPISDRELAKSTGVDIYIDTWAHVLRAIADKVKEKQTNEIFLATTKEKYQDLFKQRFENHMRRLPDCENLTIAEYNHSSDKSMWVVYEGTSDDTFLAARRLRKLHPEKRILALLASDKTPLYAEQAEADNIEFVVASEIIANVIRDVRSELKKGRTPDEIQANLDAYAPSLDITLEQAQVVDIKSSPDDQSMVCIFDTATSHSSNS